jgi:hypothetical protein
MINTKTNTNTNTNTKTNFLPNATVTREFYGDAENHMSGRSKQVKLPVGHRVEVVGYKFLWSTFVTETGAKVRCPDSSRPIYTVRCQDPINPQPNLYWTLRLGDSYTPATDVLAQDSYRIGDGHILASDVPDTQ